MVLFAYLEESFQLGLLVHQEPGVKSGVVVIEFELLAPRLHGVPPAEYLEKRLDPVPLVAYVAKLKGEGPEPSIDLRVGRMEPLEALAEREGAGRGFGEWEGELGHCYWFRISSILFSTTAAAKGNVAPSQSFHHFVIAGIT